MYSKIERKREREKTEIFSEFIQISKELDSLKFFWGIKKERTPFSLFYETSKIDT